MYPPQHPSNGNKSNATMTPIQQYQSYSINGNTVPVMTHHMTTTQSIQQQQQPQQMPVVTIHTLPVLPMNGVGPGGLLVTATPVHGHYLTPMQQMFEEELDLSPTPEDDTTKPINTKDIELGSFTKPTQNGTTATATATNASTNATSHFPHLPHLPSLLHLTHTPAVPETAEQQADRLAREAEKAAENYKADPDQDKDDVSWGVKFLMTASAILAAMICIGGSVILSWNNRALSSYNQCDQLYVWGLLFVIFEALHLIGLFIQACFSGESWRSWQSFKRIKSLILLVQFFMSVLFFVWGTIIINTSDCSYTDNRSLWLYFKVLYWFIIGVWSVVLIIVTFPIILFFILKSYMKRSER